MTFGLDCVGAVVGRAECVIVGGLGGAGDATSPPDFKMTGVAGVIAAWVAVGVGGGGGAVGAFVGVTTEFELGAPLQTVAVTLPITFWSPIGASIDCSVA